MAARRQRDRQAAAHGLEDLRQLGLLADELRLEAEYAWTDMPADDDWDWWLELEADKAWENARAGFGQPASELARLDAIKALAAADKAAWDQWAPARAGVRRGVEAARQRGLRHGATGKRPSVRRAMSAMGL